MFNTISIEGRLVADPQIKTTPSGLSICNISVACDRSVKREGKLPLFIGVTFFGSMADNVAKYFHKGRPIIVSGRLENDVVEDKVSGEKEQIYYINATSFDFPLSDKPEPQPKPTQRDAMPISPDPAIDIVDDDLPF